MKNKVYFFKQVSALLLMVFVAIISSSMLQAKESIEDGLERCALTHNSSARLVCYDLLSGRTNKNEPEIVETPVLPAKGLVAKPEIIETPSLPEKKVEAKASIVASETKVVPENQILNITKCVRSGGNDKYTFYLDDGQVWKQVSHKRMNFKDCNFEVSLHKDFFGFKMQIEETKKKFRVSRVR